MKSTSKLVTRGVAILVLASMGVMFVVQQQALKRVRQQNGLLQQQVDELTAQAKQLADERERVSKLIAVQEANAGSPLAPEPSSELLRLRGEVGRLRLQERESEQSRRDEMQAAQAQIPNAETELARLTKLHSKNLISTAELEQARSNLELLKAQAKGDAAEVPRVKLQQAEAELARADELRKRSLISQTEYDEAVRKLESAKAGAGR